MRSEILKAVILTILFALIYAIPSYQDVYFGKTVLAIGLENLVTIYALLLAYIILGISNYTRPLKPFSLSAAIYFILEIAVFNLSSYQQFAVLFPFFQSLKVYIFMFLFSFALARVELPFEARWVRYAQPAISTTGLVLMGFSGYAILSKLPFDVSEEIGIIFLVFLVVLAITTLSNISSSNAAQWLRRSRPFLLGSLLAISIYYIFIRPHLLDRTGLANFLEWFIVGFVLFKLSRDLKRSLEVDEREIIEVHRQRVSLRKDEWIEMFTRAQHEFIEKGVKSLLVASLCRILFEMGWSEARVARAISQIVTYRDEEPPALSFGWERKFIEGRNRKRRAKLVEELKNYLIKEGVRVES